MIRERVGDKLGTSSGENDIAGKMWSDSSIQGDDWLVTFQSSGPLSCPVCALLLENIRWSTAWL